MSKSLLRIFQIPVDRSECEIMTKKVVALVRAIRNENIKLEKPKEEPNIYRLWGDDSSSIDKAKHCSSNIPTPKPKLPGREGAVMSFLANIEGQWVCVWEVETS
ncbi:hypothetical protein GIB67_003300 [Kingdonia uniflora]|uniref:BOP1 N-terminal domain-containing protein n=1 Tax=Kingdonia uniflora TaxID=39325 RepID=A0A7J7P953_9MAGN|nr:hypothetical protein GIB67_003300 [Kingdonia uniflora]